MGYAADHYSELHTDSQSYVVVTTFGEARAANGACAALEAIGIPVMIEHVHVREAKLHGIAYRVLVPVHFSQTALTVLSGLGVANQDDAVFSDAFEG